MKYKIGDKVRIKSLDWYNENKGNADKTNSVWCEDGDAWFYYHMSQYCGKIMTIQNAWAYSYTLEGSDSRWTDEMIEGLVEEPVLSAPNITDNVFISEKDMKWTTEYLLPDGYIFKDENGNIINAKKIVLEKKKKEYPKTYEECCKILGLNDLINMHLSFIDIDTKIIASTNYHIKTLIRLNCLTKLLICRDAYWKLYGEEMGLGKGWKPQEGVTYCYMSGAPSYIRNIFPFPIEEMREVFYENFKDLIEQCKELL